MTSPLENLRSLGHLHEEPPDAKEFAALKHSGLVRLADAERHANSLESRFDLAYHAAHALSLAALRHEVWRVPAHCHDVRNRGEYEGDFYADERLLADLISACKAVAVALDALPALTPER